MLTSYVAASEKTLRSSQLHRKVPMSDTLEGLQAMRYDLRFYRLWKIELLSVRSRVHTCTVLRSIEDCLERD